MDLALGSSDTAGIGVGSRRAWIQGKIPYSSASSIAVHFVSRLESG